MIHTDRIGIWGFGVVGKAAARYFHKIGIEAEIFDTRPMAESEQEFIKKYDIRYTPSQTIENFLEKNSSILPSPGIDLRPYDKFKKKWIAELDLFQQAFKKPIIAITGSVGKTSVTHLLSHILTQKNISIVTGGNIGIGMLDLVDAKADMAILEVSSFQLELCKTFAPDLAICTNIYPNHLDRHGSFDNYFDAKYSIVARQSSEQQALLPFSWYSEFVSERKPQSRLAFFTTELPTEARFHQLGHDATLFYYGEKSLIKYHNQQNETIAVRSEIPPISFEENWIMVYGALTMLRISTHDIDKNLTCTLPDHRLEKIATINAIDFYNDSKSTTPASTLAAVRKISGKPIHLFVGGISKGIDRSSFVEQLKDSVAFVYCFGKESDQLHTMCRNAGIASSCSPDLETSFELCTQKIKPGDRVLFSPAGASFDLFKDYKERGEFFKKLVEQLQIKE